MKRKALSKNSIKNNHISPIILVGASDRGMIYAKQSLDLPQKFQIVAIVEPIEERRNLAEGLFSIPEKLRFPTVEEAVALPKFADAIFNCTMDSFHADTSIPFLEKGYHILLKKPIAPNRTDAECILHCAQINQRIVMVCHVLRYAPFYKTIKQLILNGDIGEIIDIQMTERVSNYHESVSYVRRKYGDSSICSSGMLLSKCSHDLDIMTWLMADYKPVQVFSAGVSFAV